MTGPRGDAATPGRPAPEPAAPATPVPASPASGPAGADAPVKAPPWDPTPAWHEHQVLARLEVLGSVVADYVDGSGAPAFDSPRPHLHPVRTPAGTVVTDSAPRDHTWHAGLGVGVQDVAGSNLWGGRTYVRDTGYTWRHDHGSVRHDAWDLEEPTLHRERLTWFDAEGLPVLTEARTLRWGPAFALATGTGWLLELTSVLMLAAGRSGPVPLGSPGSNGRAGGGYGGFFWRLPACQDVDVRTPVGRGEDAVHGSAPGRGASWVAWSARSLPRDRTAEPGASVGGVPLGGVFARDGFGRVGADGAIDVSGFADGTASGVGDGVAATPFPPGGPVAPGGAAAADGTARAAAAGVVPAGPPEGGDFTVALAPARGQSADDPWFVRVADYPGLGSAWAWDRPAVVEPGAPFTRGLRCLVADGRLTDEEVAAALLGTASAAPPPRTPSSAPDPRPARRPSTDPTASPNLQEQPR